MAEKARILVVEDDENLRESLVAQLMDIGYDVRQASSGDEAIPLAHGTRFDLIILDLKMPYVDGFEVLKFIKGTFPQTKVIVLTGYADLRNIEKCKNLGADEVIEKPYNLEYLLTIIGTYIKG